MDFICLVWLDNLTDSPFPCPFNPKSSYLRPPQLVQNQDPRILEPPPPLSPLEGGQLRARGFLRKATLFRWRCETHSERRSLGLRSVRSRNRPRLVRHEEDVVLQAQGPWMPLGMVVVGKHFTFLLIVVLANPHLTAKQYLFAPLPTSTKSAPAYLKWSASTSNFGQSTRSEVRLLSEKKMGT